MTRHSSVRWAVPRAHIRSLMMAAGVLLGGAASAIAQDAAKQQAIAPELAEQVRAEVAARWDVEPSSVRLEWGAVREGTVLDEDVTFEFIGAGTTGSWVVAFTHDDGRPALRVRLRAGLELATPVAARELPRGTTLEAEDIDWSPSVRWGPPGPDTEIEAGWVTQRRVAAGEALRVPAVARPAVVSSGEPVQAVWSRGGVQLTLRARALGTAAHGERVRIRTNSGERLEGRATGPGQVHIDASGESIP